MVDMFQIPQYVLEKLRCCICSSYLSSKPLMVREEDQQVCGKCYKLLPTEEKEKCVRQIGLETIAEIITFPCRYNTNGCSYTFNWCDEKDHESDCPYRSLLNFSKDVSNNSIDDNAILRPISLNDNEIYCESHQLKAKLHYNSGETIFHNGSKNIEYSLNLRGNCDYSLVLKNYNTSEEINDIEIRIEGVLHAANRSELISSKIEIKPITYENLYASIRSYNLIEESCSNCRATVTVNSRKNCLLGHMTCANCTGNVCIKCVQNLDKDSKTVCKNYPKGCREILNQEIANKHEVNCSFNDYKCILEPCNDIGNLLYIKQHIRTCHASEIYSTNEVHKMMSNKDEVIVIMCYGNLFKGIYYYYKSFVEFYITFIGSSDESVNYICEISVNVKGNILTRRSKCSNWNDVMLEKGIVFEKTELLKTQDKRLNFPVTIKIINKI